MIINQLTMKDATCYFIDNNYVEIYFFFFGLTLSFTKMKFFVKAWGNQSGEEHGEMVVDDDKDWHPTIFMSIYLLSYIKIIHHQVEDGIPCASK